MAKNKPEKTAPASTGTPDVGAAASGSGGGSGAPPGGMPPFVRAPGTPDGTAASPFVMISKKEARKFNSVTTPFGRYFDMSTKEGSIQWYRMVTPADDHVKLDVLVKNSKAILDLFTDLSTTFRWARFLRIPVEGTGTIAGTPTITSGGRKVFNVDFTEYKELLEEYQHISLDQIKAFVSWFMGDDSQALDKRDETKKDALKMFPVDVNATGNAGLVNRFKVQCRIVSGIILHTIKNHFTSTSYKSFFVHKKEFSYTCSETDEVSFEGFTLLKMMLNVVKPDVVIDVKDLEQKIRKMTILTADNNFRTLATKMEELQQEINAQKGEDYFKDDHFLTEFFRACEATKNEKFENIVSTAKTNWITHKEKDKSVIINDLSNVYKNMVAEGSWNKTSDKDAKIIALTSQIEGSKKKFGEFDERIKALKSGKPAGKKSEKADGFKNGKDAWKFNKKGETCTHPVTGAQMKWCQHHGSGMYMPGDHNHEEWKKRKAERTVAFEERRGKKEKSKSTGASGDKSLTPNKLQLSKSIRSALVTSFSMTSADADKVFNEAYDDASSSKD